MDANGLEPLDASKDVPGGSCLGRDTVQSLALPRYLSEKLSALAMSGRSLG